MKQFKIPLLLMAALLLPACSQHKPEPVVTVPTTTERLYTLQNKLGLSLEQLDAIRPILEKGLPQKAKLQQAINDAGDDEKKVLQHKLEDLEWDMFKKVSATMTREQVDKYVDLLLKEDRQPAKAEPEEKSDSPQPRGRGPRP